MNSVNSCFESAAKRFRGAIVYSFFVSLLLFAFAVIPAHAQLTTGVFAGTVTDPQGASVAGAEVAITNVGTGSTVTVKTSAEGSYRVSELPVGTYRFTVTAAGFKKALKTGVYLNSGTIERVDFKLELGQQSEMVTVEAGAIQVQTEDSRLSTTIGAAQISNLPLNGRNVFDLITLAPGAVDVTGVSFENGHSTVINGLRPNFSGFMINGASDKGLSGGAVTVPPLNPLSEAPLIMKPEKLGRSPLITVLWPFSNETPVTSTAPGASVIKSKTFRPFSGRLEIWAAPIVVDKRESSVCT